VANQLSPGDAQDKHPSLLTAFYILQPFLLAPPNHPQYRTTPLTAECNIWPTLLAYFDTHWLRGQQPSSMKISLSVIFWCANCFYSILWRVINEFLTFVVLEVFCLALIFTQKKDNKVWMTENFLKFFIDFEN